jgi:AAA15 family ATPase/GTPase
MINALEIRNFKSIKNLKLDCKRINIFIGKTNTGKSNILESVGIFSFLHQLDGSLKDFVRFKNMPDLFYHYNTSEKIEITANGMFRYEIKFKNGRFVGKGRDGGIEFLGFNFDYNGCGSSLFTAASPFKFYRFSIIDKFTKGETNYLLPPKGENLFSIFQKNKSLKKVIGDILSEKGFRIVLNPESKIEVQNENDDVIIFDLYPSVSETLQRVVFHLTAIETNKDSILIFEEPAAYAFPFYTECLAERITLDKSNQYFISTHDHYFLSSIFKKATQDDIRVFLVDFKNSQTGVRALKKDDMRVVPQLNPDILS